PKTQSALLEAMQEVAVTVGGTPHPLQIPFFVLATQNPIEMDGTYALPEAQLDRFFFKLDVRYPEREELVEIMDRTTRSEQPPVTPIANGESVEALKSFVREVPVASAVKHYIARVVMATHPTSATAPESIRRFIRYGASPRGAQAIVLASKTRALLGGRYNVSYDDVQAVALPALRHRLILNFEGEAENASPDALIQDILDAEPSAQ
ncbi:MAG: AAA family ATPase, partial [Gammaproteobacteria bacterium]